MNEEIFAGLKNAMERGATLDVAMRSFINAGYNPQEVRAEGNKFSGGASEIVYKRPEQIAPEERKIAPLPRINNLGEKKKRSDWQKTLLIISIIISGVIFLGAIGYLVWTWLK